MVIENVISFQQTAGAARQRLLDNKAKPVVAAIRSRLVETLPRLLQDLFEHLDDELYELADKSTNDMLQTQFFEAMREIRKLRESFENGFLRAQLGHFDDFWKKPINEVSAETESPEELSLVADEELEEELAVSSIISKSENRFHRELFALNARFASLLRVDPSDLVEQPLRPQLFVESFHSILQQWKGGTAVRLVVYKLFDRYVMSFIGGFYDDVNDVFIKADILPKVVQQARRNPVAPSVQRARNPQNEIQHPIADAALSADTLNTLSGLLSRRRRGSDSMGASASFAWSAADVQQHLPEVSMPDLLSALDRVQLDSLHNVPVDLDEVQVMKMELMQSLGRQLEVDGEGVSQKRLARPEQDVIDVMGMLFDFILGDENLPEAMKALLGRLQIPMLKVAVIDHEFFSDKEHPARLLLNALARAAMAWQDDGDRSRDGNYGYIEKVVTRVLSEFSDDVSVFANLYEEFLQHQQRIKRGADVAEQRVAQVEHGQEQLSLARQRVTEVLNDIAKDCQKPDCIIPEAIKNIFEEGWHDVLLLAYLREGEASNAWVHAHDIAEKLVWSVQPKHEALDRKNLLKVIPELLKQVREGLMAISFDQNRSSVLLKQIQSCHILALRGQRAESKQEAKTEETENKIKPAALDAVETDQVEVEMKTLDDEFQQQASNLQVGDWFEWQDESTNVQRAKLSWKSDITGNCVFVNSKGIKVAEMDPTAIALLLRTQQAKQLENIQKPLMDRALDAMMMALKNTESSQLSAN